MAFPFRRVLSPVAFDDNSMVAMDLAAEFARQNDGIVFLLYVVPMSDPPVGGPAYVELYKEQTKIDHAKLQALAEKRMRGVKYEVLTDMGDPSAVILKTERAVAADVVVMATQGRKGFAHVFLGSTVEAVLRGTTCPVLALRHYQPDESMVGRWMSVSPETAAPDEKLSSVSERMVAAGFRTMPVLDAGRLVGMITNHELHKFSGALERTVAKDAMIQAVTVTPETSTHDAARILREKKLAALPVVDKDQLAGIISADDMLGLFTSEC
ncbi:MAG TPA: universal stress protein [Candidatus Binataceae bacterium]|nr:universal stress protein [Candidatus Binataceae bacterium]